MRAEAVGRQTSVVELLRRIVGNLEMIVRTELRLLKVELLDDAAEIGGASVFLILGFGLAQLAIGCLLLSLIYALATRLSPWLAALIVAAGCGAVAAVLLQAGRQRLSRMNLSRQQADITQEASAPWENMADPWKS
ncbi:MAG: phage holin family protein [Gemmatimonadota bacterium]|nr:phage holin family protein [Gemmatimonadota bacterium]